MTCCGKFTREQGGKGRKGASEGRRKASVVQSCEPPESREEKLQEYCIQKASGVGCRQKSGGNGQDPAREFYSL